MKAIIHERYIIPIASINFIQRINSKDIRIYLQRSIDGHACILLRYDSDCECSRAYEHIARMLSE